MRRWTGIGALGAAKCYRERKDLSVGARRGHAQLANRRLTHQPNHRGGAFERYCPNAIITNDLELFWASACGPA